MSDEKLPGIDENDGTLLDTYRDKVFADRLGLETTEGNPDPLENIPVPTKTDSEKVAQEPILESEKIVPNTENTEANTESQKNINSETHTNEQNNQDVNEQPLEAQTMGPEEFEQLVEKENQELELEEMEKDDITAHVEADLMENNMHNNAASIDFGIDPGLNMDENGPEPDLNLKDHGPEPSLNQEDHGREPSLDLTDQGSGPHKSSKLELDQDDLDPFAKPNKSEENSDQGEQEKKKEPIMGVMYTSLRPNETIDQTQKGESGDDKEKEKESEETEMFKTGKQPEQIEIKSNAKKFLKTVTPKMPVSEYKNNTPPKRKKSRKLFDILVIVALSFLILIQIVVLSGLVLLEEDMSEFRNLNDISVETQPLPTAPTTDQNVEVELEPEIEVPTRSAVPQNLGNGFNILSEDFGPNNELPAYSHCSGEGVSPALNISEYDSNIEYFAIFLTGTGEDADKVYWVNFNISVSNEEVPKDNRSLGRLGVNNIVEEELTLGYEAHCADEQTEYKLEVYGLPDLIGGTLTQKGATKDALMQEISELAVDSTEVTVVYDPAFEGNGEESNRR